MQVQPAPGPAPRSSRARRPVPPQSSLSFTAGPGEGSVSLAGLSPGARAFSVFQFVSVSQFSAVSGRSDLACCVPLPPGGRRAQGSCCTLPRCPPPLRGPGFRFSGARGLAPLQPVGLIWVPITQERICQVHALLSSSAGLRISMSFSRHWGSDCTRKPGEGRLPGRERRSLPMGSAQTDPKPKD